MCDKNNQNEQEDQLLHRSLLHFFDLNFDLGIAAGHPGHCDRRGQSYCIFTLVRFSLVGDVILLAMALLIAVLWAVGILRKA